MKLTPSRSLWQPGLSFFFSSRRRHTCWNCDWSSDVCSSDLDDRGLERHGAPAGGERLFDLLRDSQHGRNRSEERRVGKEGKYQRSARPDKSTIEDRGKSWSYDRYVR